MKLFNTILPILSQKVLLVICLFTGLFLSGNAATFTVSNTNNSGAGSFRQAIFSANGAAGADIIVFSIAGVINVVGAMPGITGPVTIDARTAPGYVCGQPTVAIDGGGGSANGLQFLPSSAGSSVLGLNVRNFQFNGIQFIGSPNMTVQSCLIGTDLTGTVDLGNGQNGVQVEVGADNTLIGGSNPCDRNIISGNNGVAITLNQSDNCVVSGNYMGVDITGTSALGNGFAGMLVVNNTVGALIGGSLPSERNIISGNGSGINGNGIEVNGGSANIIRGNYIGLDATGSVAINNAGNGITVFSSPNNVIGGTGANDGNVIAGSNFDAIILAGGSNNASVFGNKVGTNAAGTIALGNDDSGLYIENTTGVTVGGTTAGHRNLFAASLNEYGISLDNADNCTVLGNYVGTDINGVNPLPNSAGGIRVDTGSVANVFGGTGAGQANIIAFNTGFGIGVIQATDVRNRISGNSIFCNTGKGIELNGAGNGNHPAPVIASADATGCNGSSDPNNIIELFYDSLCTGTCQGKTYIGTVTADGAGNWAYVGPLNNGTTLAATARDVSPIANIDNTSEFSCFVLLPVEGLVLSAERVDMGAGQGSDVVQIDWQTSYEANNWFFSVERSKDGLNFDPIGEVAGKGDTPSGFSYGFVDSQAPSERLYYRLRQVDFDGSEAFSSAVEVRASIGAPALLLHGHPVQGDLKFSLQYVPDGEVLVTLMDIQGRTVVEKSMVKVGEGTLVLPASQLPEGGYLLRVTTGSTLLQKRVFVLSSGF